MTADATSLHCPNCGGPAGPGDQTCRYCHAALATVACPACFAVMFEGSAYCPHCGARRARAESAAGRTVRCPACKGIMREVRVGDTALMECAGCQGLWIDSATFQHICADKDAQAVVAHQWNTPPPPSPAGEIRYRPCVACGKLMNRMNFGRVSGTIVDVCKGHGTFLDAGELHLIVSFIQQGGLDRARQRQIDELKEREEHLRTLQSGQDAHPTVRLDTTVHTWTGADLLKLLERIGRE